MPVLINLAAEPQPIWVRCPLPEGDHFEVCLRPPSFEQICADFDHHGPGRTAARLKALACDWRNVEQPVAGRDDGTTEAARFDYEQLAGLLGRYPAAHAALAAACRRRFLGMPEPKPQPETAPAEAA